MPRMVQNLTDHRVRVLSGLLACRAMFADCCPQFFKRTDSIWCNIGCIGDLVHFFAPPSEFFTDRPAADPQQDSPTSFIIRSQNESCPISRRKDTIIFHEGLVKKLSHMSGARIWVRFLRSGGGETIAMASSFEAKSQDQAPLPVWAKMA